MCHKKTTFIKYDNFKWFRRSRSPLLEEAKHISPRPDIVILIHYRTLYMAVNWLMYVGVPTGRWMQRLSAVIKLPVQHFLPINFYSKEYSIVLKLNKIVSFYSILLQRFHAVHDIVIAWCNLQSLQVIIILLLLLIKN